MKWASQGATESARYGVIPRTLVFVQHGEDLLLLRGAPDKRLWAGRLNGLGGHVAAGEDILSSARREVLEEAGLLPDALALRGLIHVTGKEDAPGVLLFVFMGVVGSPVLHPGGEGNLAWYPLDALPWDEMVEDLPLLLPRLLAAEASGQLVYGHYEADAAGRMRFHFLES